jgi:integrase
LNESAQRLLEPFLIGKRTEEAVFSHRVSAHEVKELRRAERQSKVPRSQERWDKQQPENPLTKAKEFFDRNTYRKAIVAAIKRANKKMPDGQKIPHWFPYQIRHSTSTAIEIAEGLDKSQAVLGHKTPNTTRIYSKGQLAIAEKVVRKLGNPFETGNEVNTLCAKKFVKGQKMPLALQPLREYLAG